MKVWKVCIFFLASPIKWRQKQKKIRHSKTRKKAPNFPINPPATTQYRYSQLRSRLAGRGIHYPILSRWLSLEICILRWSEQFINMYWKRRLSIVCAKYLGSQSSSNKTDEKNKSWEKKESKKNESRKCF